MIESEVVSRIAQETLDYVCQRGKYFESELKYSDELLALMEKSSDGWFTTDSDQAFLTSAREYLRSLRSGLAALWNAYSGLQYNQHEKFTNDHYLTWQDRLFKAEQILEWLAKGLHHLQVFIQQAKKRPIRNYSYVSMPALTLGEIHPSYVLEIEVIYQLNCVVHEFISRLLCDSPDAPGIKLRPALICISDQKDYHFDTACNNPLIMKLILSGSTAADKLSDAKGFKEYAALKLGARHVSIPRFSPGELKYSTLLVHEIVHSFYQLVHGELYLALRRNLGDGAITRSQILATFGGWVGTRFCDFAISLAKTHRRFANREDYTGHGKNGYFDIWGRQCKKENLGFEIASFVEEFVADYISLYICGPAYFYALLVNCFNDLDQTSGIRLSFLGKQLDDLGYTGNFQALVDNLRPTPDYELLPRFDDCYEVLVCRDELFDDIKESCRESLGKQPVSPNDYEEICGDICGKIKSGNYAFDLPDYVDENARLLWIMNAIWYKIQHRPFEEKPYHIWRMAMKYSA